MSLLSDYLRAIRTIRAAPSTPELSFYNALADLLNEVGEEQEPPVQCVMNLEDTGSGLPDGGLFTDDQLPESTTPLFEGQMEAPHPSRGAIEVKSADQSIEELQQSEQVSRYLREYGTVLITNYRRFRLLSSDEGEQDVLERFTLAESEQTFNKMTAEPDQVDPELEERFSAFLRRVMVHGAPLAHPEDIAWLLASYAQDAKLRLETSSLEDLNPLREALETALGVTFQGEKGEQFFRSTILQTLFYGVFSAWVLWHRENPTREDRFDWKNTAELLRVPVLQTLFHQLVAPGQLRALRILELMNWTGDALNRVDRPVFFERFSKEEAVQYFYEPFLDAFDPELRKDLGVWYTPPEIVEYQVRRVDTVLREELDIADGLADERVKILDPCCGTGAYLVETLRFLEERFQEQGEGDLAPALAKQAATSRIYGFEILTAPFVVSHLQLGLTLAEMGTPLEDDERAGVYLTNALTGWEPPDEPQTILFKDLADEREEADTIKQEEDILVIFGNPPYDGYPGVAPEESEERELSNAYRESPEDIPNPQGHGLNDLYVRFYRMAERQITEQTGKGIVSYISNYSWLDGLSHTGMRAQYLEAFDRIWIDNMNGDKYRTGKTTPEGDPDPSVFSTEHSRIGIQVGTAVSVLCRHAYHDDTAELQYREFWGAEKRANLLNAAEQSNAEGYRTLEPPPELGLPYIPRETGSDYLNWPKLTELFPTNFPGVKTSRDDVVVDTDRGRLETRMREYFDPDVSDEEIADRYPRLMESSGRFEAEKTRAYLVQRGFKPENIVRYCYRPMDVRWLYWEPETKLLDEKRASYFPHVFDGNVSVEARQRIPKAFDRGYVTSVLADNFGSGLSNFFPLYLNPKANGGDLFSQPSVDGDEGESVPNLSDAAAAYLDRIDADVEALFYHMIATLHAPTYRQENDGALRQDWPRVPLPKDRDVLRESAELGREVAALLDVEQDVSGIDAGTIREELQPLGSPEHVESDQTLDPSRDFAVTAGWGYEGHHGATMPGGGEYEERAYTPDEEAKLPNGALERWGAETLDIYLNDRARWTNVPARVWNYTLGGYSVVKKWLSYREEDVLGRDLTIDEVRHVTNIVRRIAVLLLLEPRLDANYEAVKASTTSTSAT